jgi:hypothetical protein
MGGAEWYREQFGIPTGVPLWCEKFAKNKSRVSKRKCTPHVRKYWRENPDALRGKAKPTTWKTLPQGDVVTDSMLAWAWIVDRRPVEKIAAKYRMSKGAVMRRLHRILGFPIRRSFCAVRGELVSKLWINGLLGRFRLKVHELGEALGRDRNFADNLTRPSERSGVPRRSSAEAAVKFEHELLAVLLTAKRVSKPAMLKAVVPDLEAKYRALLEPFTWLLSGSNGNNLRDNLDIACQESRDEVSKEGPYCWRTFLCTLPDLADFLKGQNEWKIKWQSASKLVTAFLAADIGTEMWVVTSALFERTPAMPPNEVSLWVRFALDEIAKKRSGRKPGEDQLTRRRKKLAAAYLRLGLSKTDMAAHVFCDTPRSQQANIWPFFHSPGPAIEVMAKLNLTRRQAELITKHPKSFLYS